jgi:hypothetical protein
MQLARLLAVSVRCAPGLVLAVVLVGQFVTLLDATIVNVAHYPLARVSCAAVA